MESLILTLHARLPRAVLAITGGGAGALGPLLAVPGGSRWLLEAVVPYSSTALADFLGRPPEQACGASTAQAMARRALERAHWLAPGEPVLGLGASASLASDRPKKGDHRIHVSIATAQGVKSWSLTLNKGQRDRAGEEALCSDLILHALASALDLSPLPALPLHPQEQVERSEHLLPLLPGPESVLHLTADGLLETLSLPPPVTVSALLPGAFNPLHQGHWTMAEAARGFLGKSVAFELSTVNVDKPEISPEELRRRLDQFAGRAEVWVTRAPRFLDKARLFPGITFVVGVDTALRLVDVKYYDGAMARMREVLTQIQERGCRFLVACRQLAENCLTLADVPIPEGFADLFQPLPPELFRWDISSTHLRQRS